MPGLRGREQGEESVPEAPAALRREGAWGEHRGRSLYRSSQQLLCRPIPQTYEDDVVLGPPAERRGGPALGVLPQGAPLPAQLLPAQQRGMSEGGTGPRMAPAVGALPGWGERTYRRVRFSARLRGTLSSMWLRWLGERLSSSFTSRLRLSGGTRGSVGHGQPGHSVPILNPGWGQCLALPAPTPGGPSPSSVALAGSVSRSYCRRLGRAVWQSCRRGGRLLRRRSRAVRL